MKSASLTLAALAMLSSAEANCMPVEGVYDTGQCGGLNQASCHPRWVCGWQAPVPTNCVPGTTFTHSACSATCGGGTLTTTRSGDVQPTNGGDACDSTTTPGVACNSQDCPTLYTEDAGTDMSLNMNNHSDAFCAHGYKLVESSFGTAHASFDTAKECKNRVGPAWTDAEFPAPDGASCPGVDHWWATGTGDNAFNVTWCDAQLGTLPFAGSVVVNADYGVNATFAEMCPVTLKDVCSTCASDNATLPKFKTCEKCPPGYTSNGGTSLSCHPVSNDWETCTHMGCELEKVATKACAYHGSSNPKDDLNGSIAIVETKCHEWNDKHTVQRIKVFHHGHEQAGTSHKCSLNVDKHSYNKTLNYTIDSARACRCQCKTATVDEQTLQQNSKDEDDAMYAIRAAAQAARDHARQFNVTGDENPYQHSTDQNGNVSYEHAMHDNTN